MVVSLEFVLCCRGRGVGSICIEMGVVSGFVLSW